MTRTELFETYRLHASIYIAASRMDVPEHRALEHEHPDIAAEMARARQETPIPRIVSPGTFVRMGRGLRLMARRFFFNHSEEAAG